LNSSFAVQTSVDANDLGTTLKFLATQFKLWPVSGHVGRFIEAAIDIQSVHDIAVDDIAGVQLVGSPAIRQLFEPADERRRPSNAASAANSIQFATAKALVHRKVTLGDFTAEGLRDPVVVT
jgi:2-methylcitrate dehydratase PrpD